MVTKIQPNAMKTMLWNQYLLTNLCAFLWCGNALWKPTHETSNWKSTHETSNWKPTSQKETTPLATLVTTSGLYLDDLQAIHLNPTRSQHTKPRSGNKHLFLYLRSFRPSLFDLFELFELSHLNLKLLSSLRIIHPLLILQVDCTMLRFVDLLTNLRCQ